jgi:RNA polymerase sigma-70 factor (ECF subfamily)
MHHKITEELREKVSSDFWLEEHGDALYRYALSRVRLTHAAEDLVQETLLAGLNGAAKFHARSAVRTWLIGILKHKVMDYRRRQLCAQDKDSLDDEGYFFKKNGSWKIPVTRWHRDPGALMEVGELRAAIDLCLSKLPGRLAVVFLRREADDISTEELCKEMGLSATNVWSSLHRARLRLRECLAVNWFGKEAADTR